MTLHPVSHNILMEMSDACDRPGKMCASFVYLGIHGMSSMQVCVNVRQSQSGRFILSGCRAIFMFVTGVPGKTKRPVAPASATAMFYD